MANGAGEVKLYDLENDMSESQDVLAAKPDEAARLAELWNEWNRGNVNGKAYPYLGTYQHALAAWFAEYHEGLRTSAENAPRRVITLP